MARYGNTSVSALLSAATAAQNKIATYNDAIASTQYQDSAKTQSDLDTYTSYLKTRQAATTDPSKLLSLQNAAVTANKSFTTAEIGRQSQQVAYGNISSTDKYHAISSLLDRAVQNGDDALAQSLDEQLTGLSKTIQDEQVAAQGKAEAGNYSDLQNTISTADGALSQAKAALRQGQLGVSQYQETVANIIGTKQAIYQKAAQGGYGSLSQANADTLTSDYQKFTTSEDYQNAQGRSGLEAEPDQALTFKPGTNTYSLGDRPVNYVNPDGTNSYASGVTTDATGKATSINRIALPAGGGTASPITDKTFTIPKGQPGAGEQAIFDPRTQKYLYQVPGTNTYSVVDPATISKNDVGNAYLNAANPVSNLSHLGDTLKTDAGALGGVFGAAQKALSAPATALKNIIAPSAAVRTVPQPQQSIPNRLFIAPNPTASPAQASTGDRQTIGAINSAIGNKAYLAPYQSTLGSNYNIVANGTNYGGTVAQLRQAGVTDTQLSRGGQYDLALRAANDNGQFH